MGDWRKFEDKINEYLKSKNLSAAKEELTIGLEKTPNQFHPLIIATDVCSESDDPEKSLEYSELLITHHPDDWNGYYRAAQNLSALKRFKEAQEKIQAGLEKLPNQLILLIIASDVYHQPGDLEKSLEYSELLIKHHPENWNGYKLHTENLLVSKNYKKARDILFAANNHCHDIPADLYEDIEYKSECMEQADIDF